MTKSPDAVDVEKSPALSALQTLKYELRWVALVAT